MTDSVPPELEASPPFEELVGMAADIACVLSWDTGHGCTAMSGTLGCHQPLHTFSPPPSHPTVNRGAGH